MHGLEPRVLLSGEDLKHGPLAKVASIVPLWHEYKTYLSTHAGSSAGFTPSGVGLHVSGDSVAIEAYTTASPKTLETVLKKFQLHDQYRFANGVAGWIPLNNLSAIAALNSLTFARPAWYVLNTGSVTSQGDISLKKAAILPLPPTPPEPPKLTLIPPGARSAIEGTNGRAKHRGHEVIIDSTTLNQDNSTESTRRPSRNGQKAAH